MDFFPRCRTYMEYFDFPVSRNLQYLSVHLLFVSIPSSGILLQWHHTKNYEKKCAQGYAHPAPTTAPDGNNSNTHVRGPGECTAAPAHSRARSTTRHKDKWKPSLHLAGAIHRTQSDLEK